MYLLNHRHSKAVGEATGCATLIWFVAVESLNYFLSVKPYWRSRRRKRVSPWYLSHKLFGRRAVTQLCDVCCVLKHSVSQNPLQRWSDSRLKLTYILVHLMCCCSCPLSEMAFYTILPIVFTFLNVFLCFLMSWSLCETIWIVQLVIFSPKIIIIDYYDCYYCYSNSLIVLKSLGCDWTVQKMILWREYLCCSSLI